MILWMVNDLTNNLMEAIFRANRTVYRIQHTVYIHYIIINVCDGSDKHLREPSLGLVLLRFADLSLSLLPKVFEKFIDTVDATHRGFSADPVDYDRPLERIEIVFRLGEDLVGSGG